MITKTDALLNAVEKYLIKTGTRSIPLDGTTMQRELLEITKEEFEKHNATCDKHEKWRMPEYLDFIQTAEVMSRKYNIRNIILCDAYNAKDCKVLAIYNEHGDNRGIYDTSTDTIMELIKRLDKSVNMRNVSEILEHLRTTCPTVNLTSDPDLIPVNNGIFDYRKKKLMNFSPKYVFLSKSAVNYTYGAKNVMIHNDGDGTNWDVESWMQSLSDNPDIVNLLWEILGAIIRPNVSWDKSVWLYSETGSNGKGTLCELMRQLVGKNACASISLDDFSNSFILEQLIHCSAIIADENNVGTYIDKSKEMKAIVTGDPITINRKYKTPITYQFRGFMVQCLNELPRIRDRSGSFARRQLFIPMEKCFTGHERKYIKADYLKRPEVLQYVLYKVLNTDYYELSNPQVSVDTLKEYRTFNDPVRDFTQDIIPQLQWDLVPFTFIYDLYCAWFKKTNPSGILVNYRKFMQDFLSVLNEEDCGYACDDKTKKIWVSNQMRATPEPLIAEYKLSDWMNPNYSGRDVNKLCMPQFAQNYRGITKIILKPDENDNGGDEK